jgi:hypothetical protein
VKQGLLDEASQFGIRFGFTVPIHDGRGPIAALTFAADQQRPQFENCINSHARVLQLMAMYFHAHARLSSRTIEHSVAFCYLPANLNAWNGLHKARALGKSDAYLASHVTPWLLILRMRRKSWAYERSCKRRHAWRLQNENSTIKARLPPQLRVMPRTKKPASIRMTNVVWRQS